MHKPVEHKELFVILDTDSNTFWLSGMNRVSFSTAGAAKTAFSSSAKNPLRCLFGEQTRFKIVRVAITPQGIVANEI